MHYRVTPPAGGFILLRFLFSEQNRQILFRVQKSILGKCTIGLLLSEQNRHLSAGKAGILLRLSSVMLESAVFLNQNLLILIKQEAKRKVKAIYDCDN